MIQERFYGDLKRTSEITGYTIQQLNAWISGDVTPQKRTLDYIATCAYVPEFKVVFEFLEIDSTEAIRPQLVEMFRGHEGMSGIYAFYDAHANLMYVGKAVNLLEETYSAIHRQDEVQFPSGIKNKTVSRHELIRYISAYDVRTHDLWDYPKHVESLILRISKPVLNKQIGILDKVLSDAVDV